MGRSSSATVNPTLTNYGQGISQDKTSTLARFICPEVLAPAGAGKFKKFDDKEAFIIWKTERALGGKANRITWRKSDGTFDCEPQALEITIDDVEYMKAGPDNSDALEQSKIKALVGSTTLSHEDKVFELARQLPAAAGVGAWSAGGGSPIEEIDELIEKIALRAGMMPTRMAWGLSSWRIFKNHPKVLARFPGSEKIGINKMQAASLFMNPNMEMEIGVLAKDENKIGAAKSAKFILGGELFIFIASPNPSQYDPSFMKVFTTKAGSVDSVRQYRDESSRSEVFAVDWSEDIQRTGDACAERIVLS